MEMDQEARRDGAEARQIELETIESGGGSVAENGRERFHCISIIGQIEGHFLLPEGQKATKYEQLLPLLVELEEDDSVNGVLILLNTMGGDVEAGLALAEMIASMTKPTVSLVLGGGHSIGVPLATAADYSLIVPSATMTIHPVRISGMVVGVPQSFRYMSEMQKRIVGFICAHSNAEPEVIERLMMRPDQIATDCGSIVEGAEAVRYGIINEVGGLDRALAVLREKMAETTENSRKNNNKNNSLSKKEKKDAEKKKKKDV
ncbi:MAG: translocation-enhancing protein TepA [Ruminococcaceae bacterium]|nr:translocation-enhancing protein TepA [Oscillospiraceae bacterium]